MAVPPSLNINIIGLLASAENSRTAELVIIHQLASIYLELHRSFEKNAEPLEISFSLAEINEVLNALRSAREDEEHLRLLVRFIKSHQGYLASIENVKLRSNECQVRREVLEQLSLFHQALVVDLRIAKLGLDRSNKGQM